MNMHSQIANICQSAYFHLRNIARIRNNLTKKSTEILVYATITSRLDQNNCLLVGATKEQLDKLQRVQNAAARLICKSFKRDHITPILQDLHWLPLGYRCKFKVLMLVFKSLNGLAPSYLSDLIHPYIPRRCLRSANACLVQADPCNLMSCGGKAFSIIGPNLWNQLPEEIRRSDSLSKFKRLLKTYFFRLAFSL